MNAVSFKSNSAAGKYKNVLQYHILLLEDNRGSQSDYGFGKSNNLFQVDTQVRSENGRPFKRSFLKIRKSK